MKPNKIIFLVCATFSFLTPKVVAQTKTVGAIIDSIRQKGIDTLIRRHIDYNGPLHGEKHEYVIWSEDSNVKILDYSSNYSGENPHYNLKLAGKDHIFAYLHDSLNSILSDHIFPFVAKIPLGDIYYYTLSNEYHPSVLSLTIECKTGTIFTFSENIDAIKREVVGLVNLNYVYNSQTSLFKLIESIEKLPLE